MKNKKVVVAGATGMLGSQIVEELLGQGAEVTAMVRSSSNTDALVKLGVKNFVVGDMMDPASLKKALSPKHGFDVIVASAAGYTRRKKGDSAATDTIGYKNLVDATKEAGIPRFVLISILESDKAKSVPHFYNKYLIEQYLKEKKQPYIALRPGAFLDQTPDFIVDKVRKGIFPTFLTGTYGIIYTPQLAKYTAMAAVVLPDTELNTSIDIGWNKPVNETILASAFSKVLRKDLEIKPVFPSFVLKYVLPVISKFSENMADMYQMIKWIDTGVYISKDPMRQKELFGELPTVEESVKQYCTDRGLI
ncbi:SDR family oxidoreductase [Chryseobacterium sp. 3008163]|uniref:SDR family oxidoreductase n=1 Tax=Chryseobacterium sp. 3008163 TaxID=2478663 RepID=UPI000F0C36CB|nr:NAD(P)H-binding protein [Chryseobacterium sp. 3008163]AYM99253.1 NAD-dependent epimerase/dehydratase family protein [Chryseobacterium sp. 3008163]